MSDICVDAARYEGGKLVLTIAKPDFSAKRFIYDFRPGEYEIKKVRKKRSLDANAYAWKLITEIGNALRMDKESVYFDMLKSYGQGVMLTMSSDISPVGVFKYYKEVGQRLVKGDWYTDYVVYKGSSEFSTHEMSIFLDGIISEAKNLDIEHLTPEEISRMKLGWT